MDGKSTQRSFSIRRLTLRAVAIALVLMAGASLLIVAPSAKFLTVAGGTDSARVARFSVDATSAATTSSFLLDAGTMSVEFPFTVTNDSEVMVSYDVKLSLPADIEGITPTLNNGAGKTLAATSVSDDKKTYTFEKASTLAVGGDGVQTETLALVFSLDTSTAKTATYEGIKIDVVATQVD